MSVFVMPSIHIVAVGLHGLRYLFEELAPDYRQFVEVTILCAATKTGTMPKHV